MKKIIDKVCSVCKSSESCYIKFADGNKIPYYTVSLAFGTITCNDCVEKR